MAKVKLNLPGDGQALDVQLNGSSIVDPATALNFTGAVGVTDNGSGEAEVEILEKWSESEIAAGALKTVSFTPKISDTNVNSGILTKGTGATLARLPNVARGAYATDLQKSGSSSRNATGDYSVIAGGRSNQVTASNSSIGGGEFNTITQSQSTIAGGSNNSITSQRSFVSGLNNTVSGSASMALGRDCIVTQAGAFAAGDAVQAMEIASSVHGRQTIGYYTGFFSNGYQDVTSPINTAGSVQFSTGTLHAQKDGTTADTMDLSINGAGGNLSIGTNRCWNIVSSWAAVVTQITGTATGVSVGDTITQCNLFGFKNIAGTASVIGSVTNVATHSDTSMSTASMAFAASGTDLVPTFTFPTFSGGGSIVVRITMKLELTEIAY